MREEVVRLRCAGGGGGAREVVAAADEARGGGAAVVGREGGVRVGAAFCGLGEVSVLRRKA